MQPSFWQQVKELLAEAMDLPEAERPAFLTLATGDDEALRQEVEALLALEDDAGDFIEEPAASLRSLGNQAPLEGRRIGPYEVQREIGRGGMGSVYLAHRADDTYEKQVAIKLLRRGMESDEVVGRFHHERRILAQLDHPNIAKLVDAGATDDDLPYFVMEHVEGEPIDRYCDRHRLSVPARLRLFLSVCGAVAFAHRNLVVHRDLKPGNILVTEDGTPKLLDFGIAKLLSSDGEGAGQAEATVEGTRVMTPEYASPEQVMGLAITTASDVYSLGVLLYGLLTGHRPYQLTTRQGLEMARVICEQEPQRPSTAVRRVEELTAADGQKATFGPQAVSAARGEEPEKLRRRLAGDLDHIVLKALRKEPEQRYVSADQFADDIHRHLENQPVLARKGTFSYLAGRFLRRNWAPTAVAAVFLAMLVSFGVIQTQQAELLRVALDESKREQAISEEAVNFLVDIFSEANPEKAGTENLTARDLLDKSSDKIDEQFGEEPAIRADLMDIMGRSYRALGVKDRARSLLEEALAIRRSVYGEEHQKVASSLQNLGGLEEAEDHLEEAERLYRHAFAILEQVLRGQNHEERVIVRNNLAAVLKKLKKLDEAQNLVEEALEMNRQVPDKEDLRKATSLNILGSIHYSRLEAPQAEVAFREALDIRERAKAATPLNRARAMNNLASALSYQRKFEEAEFYLEEALEIIDRELGPEHQATRETSDNLKRLRTFMNPAAEAPP